MRRIIKQAENGSIIVSILVITLFLSTFVFSLIVLANSNLARARGRILLLQAQYAAESGADTAIANLNSGSTTYTGSAGEIQILDNARYRSTYEVSVADGADSKEKIITATGRVFSPKTASTASFSRTIEVTAQRSTTSTSSSLLSRNIIFIESGVKNIQAKDVYLNGYIQMNKNTTNLIAENIFVADKNTGATNCSIGGTGNLIKPSTFTDPAQTKTNITVAYNNCISPPGNTTNANFNVSANQISISKVQSTYIPWSQFMDSSYQNAPGGCNDWTTGTSPRSIPSTGNTKKTHYPDDGSNISTSCGTSGDLALGSNTFTIRDHTHVRASLCAASACTPTFNNPDTGAAGIKFVFVEGTINFENLITSPGSGPIVFVSYGTDPASKLADCPLGGSVYLGKSGTVNAAAAYLLASNGLCLDKTRFGATPALGGLSGKNIYVATNSGTPFDLALDNGFPVDQIPIDLAWRAVRYRRI
jgi:hypothetical protein